MNTMLKSEATREVGRNEVTYVVPQVDISETKDDYLLEADMPGVSKAGLEVTIDANELTIMGTRTREGERGQVLHCESSPSDYRRTFVLDPVIDSTRISAQIDRGVLTVRLPKAERVKPRKISVTD